MSRVVRFLILLTGLGAVLFFSNCANSPTVAAGPDVLRIGVTANSQPMIFKSGGEYQGLEADLGRMLAAEMGRTPHFVDRSWDRLLPSLAAGEVDIVMSGMTITSERRISADFTNPYLEVGQMLLVRGSDYGFYSDPRILALTDKKIGVEAGTVSEIIVQRYFLKATPVPLKSPNHAISALNSGKIDVFMHDSPVIWGLSAQGASQGVTMVPTAFGIENLGWAVRRGNTEILNKANAALAKWRKNGQLKAAVNRWMPTGKR